MSETPLETALISKKELGFFGRIRKTLLIKNINRDKFLKAPQYLKNDIEVMDAIISKDSSIINILNINEIGNVLNTKPELVNELTYDNKQKLLNTTPQTINMLSEKDRKHFIYSGEQFLECVKHLPINEQVDLLTKRQEFVGKSFSSSDQSLGMERFGYPKQFGKKLNFFSIDAINETFDILKKDSNYDKNNKHRISLLSSLDISNCDKELQFEIAKNDVDYVIGKMSDEVALEFAGNNPMLVSKLNYNCICKAVEQNPEYINCLPYYEKNEIIKNNPSLIKNLALKERLSKRLELKSNEGIENIEQIKQEMVGFNGITTYFAELPEIIHDKDAVLELAQFSPKVASPRGMAQTSYEQNKIINMYEGKIDSEILDAWRNWQNVDEYSKDTFEFENIIKVISNQEILNGTSKEKIIDYINSQDINKMQSIILEAYGEKAAKIIADRPGLSLNDIPNTYIFNSNIIEKFGVGTVHNMLSFETKGAMVLGELSRCPEKMELFDKFSEISNGIYEESALGFEQKLKAFSSNYDLIAQMADIEMTEEREQNLKLFLNNSIGNVEEDFEVKNFAPRNLEELDSYSERITAIYDDCFEKVGNVDEVKDLISRKFFGTKYAIDRESYSPQHYPLEAIIRHYNISKFITDDRTLSSKKFSNQELDLLELSKIISNVNDLDTLKELYTSLSKEKGIEEALNFKDVIKKVPLQYSEELVESLLTVEKARELAINGNEGINIKTQEGIEIINLHGTDFKMLIHSMGLNNAGLSEVYGKDEAEIWKNLEGGISTISGSIIESEMLASCNNPYGINLGFANVPPKQIIGMGHTDIHVSHTKKDIEPSFLYGQVAYDYSDELIRKTAAQISGVETKDPTHEYNEVTMNRYKMNPNDIGENDGSGKVMPSYIVVYGSASLRDIEFAKKFGNIPIMEIDTNVYTTGLTERAYKKEEHTAEREETTFMRNIKDSVKEKSDILISHDYSKDNGVIEKGDNYDIR